MVRSFICFCMFLATMVVLLFPVYMVYYGFVLFEGSFLTRCLIVFIGLAWCRITKPISILFGKNFKVF